MSSSIEDWFEDYVSNLDTETIKSFRKVFSGAMDCEFARIEQAEIKIDNMRTKSQERKDILNSWIADDALFNFSIDDLANELCILALYKMVEIKHKYFIELFNLEVGKRKIFCWKNLLNVLPQEAKNLPGFDAVNELRLLNNAIKHEGVISKQLAKNYPGHGKVGDELTHLSVSFERLEPEVCKYINELYKLLKSKT